MLCEICLNGLQGLWEPSQTPRLALRSEYDIHTRTRSAGKQEDDTEKDEKRPEAERYIFGHHKTIQSFMDSKDKGCVMCNRFRPTEADEETSILGYFSVFTILLKENPLMSVHYADHRGGFGFVPVTDDKNLRYNLGPTNHGAETMDLIQKWWDDCVQHHGQCRKTANPTFLPHHLLKFSKSEFHLVDRSDVSSTARYATIIYDWEGDTSVERLQLLKTSEEGLRRGRQISALPKTFRDAMDVASSLGLSYIWIDRLCSRKNPHEDRTAQNASMTEVYENSYLSIAALGARDMQEGLYFDRNPREIGPTVVQLKRGIDSEPEKFRFRFEKNWGWRLSFDEEPLVQRPWAVQERLLCPRVLHFGRKQVFWECRERNACEIQPETVCEYQDQGEGKSQKPHLWKQLLNAPDRRELEDAYQQLFVDWNAVLYTYSRCRITMPSNKLVALSRLASIMRQALESIKPGTHRYLAGHWEEQLLEGLTWNVLAPAKRVNEYRAPSWSWASVDGSINFGLHFPKEEEKVMLAKHRECVTEPVDEDDTKAVKGGWIVLTTPLLLLKVYSVSDQKSTRLNERQVKEIANPDTGIAVTVESNRPKGMLNARVIFDDIDQIQDTVFCAPILASHWFQGKYHASGIALVKVPGELENNFRRIGFSSHYFVGKLDAVTYFEKFSPQEIKII